MRDAWARDRAERDARLEEQRRKWAEAHDVDAVEALPALDRIARDVATIRAIAQVWLVLTILGLGVVAVALVRAS